MRKKVSIQQIADQLGLSKFPVSKALSGKDGVNEETRQKIIEMAKMLGYSYKSAPSSRPAEKQPPDKDKELVQNSKEFVFVCIKAGRRNGNYWERIITGIATACDQQGWGHLVYSPQNTLNEPFTFPDYINMAACVGIIITGAIPTHMLLSMKGSGLPIILVDHQEPAANLDSIVDSNTEAGKIACRRLLSTGCKSIVFAGEIDSAVSFAERYWGSYMAFNENKAGTGCDKTFHHWNIPVYTGDWIAIMKETLDKAQDFPKPIGIICSHDKVAIETLQILNDHGKSIPDEYRVIGFDNIEKAATTNPPLTTICMSKELLGYRSIEALKRRIKNKTAQAETIIIGTELIVRKSG